MQKIIIMAFVFLFAACSKNAEQRQSDDHSQHIDGLHLSDQQVQLGHIKTEVSAEHEIGDEILLTGVLTVDRDKLSAISSRVMGRIEKLYFKNTGEKISNGDVVYEIYSEELNLAIRELKLALDKRKSLRADAVDLDKIIASAKNKLRLYGLIDKQIEHIEKAELNPLAIGSNIFKIVSPVSGVISNIDIKEGDYIMEGGSIYHVADYSSLWAESMVFIDDLSKIKENMNAVVYFPGISTLKVNGKISFVNPELNSATQTNSVRIEIPNNENQLKVGMQVNVSILLNKKTVLALPTDAIINDARGSSVWVKTGHNQYKSIMVTTGMENNEYTQIISGLNIGDTIVVSGSYLLNSEYLFKKGEIPMEGHDMHKMKM